MFHVRIAYMKIPCIKDFNDLSTIITYSNSQVTFRTFCLIDTKYIQGSNFLIVGLLEKPSITTNLICSLTNQLLVFWSGQSMLHFNPQKCGVFSKYLRRVLTQFQWSSRMSPILSSCSLIFSSASLHFLYSV